VVVDAATPPYGRSHRLVTALPPQSGESAHGMTAAGKSPRLPDGSYRFAPVWRYEFGLP
jgi:hypothetical protein